MKTKTKLRLVQLSVFLCLCFNIWLFVIDNDNRILSSLYLVWGFFLLFWGEFLIRKIPHS